MEKISGTLNFYGWFHPWQIVTDDGKKIDIYPVVSALFGRLKDQPIVFDNELEGFRLVWDESSPKKLQYEPSEDGVILASVNKDGSSGFSNLTAFIPDALQRIDGRNVSITVTDTEIRVHADPNEKVYKLPYTHGNMASIPAGAEKSQCRIGTSHACVFCVATGEGFECAKGNTQMGRMVLDRLAKGEMRASRIGNCLVSGRVTDKDRERRDFERTLGDNVVLTADVPDSKRKKGDKARIFHGHTYGCLGDNEVALVFEGETAFEVTDRSLFQVLKKV